MGMRQPPRLHWRDMFVFALASSSGFTFALFAAVALYPMGPILAELKLGAVREVDTMAEETLRESKPAEHRGFPVLMRLAAEGRCRED